MNFVIIHTVLTYNESRKVEIKSTPARRQIMRKQIGESKTTMKKRRVRVQPQSNTIRILHDVTVRSRSVSLGTLGRWLGRLRTHRHVSGSESAPVQRSSAGWGLRILRS